VSSLFLKQLAREQMRIFQRERMMIYFVYESRYLKEEISRVNLKKIIFFPSQQCSWAEL